MTEDFARDMQLLRDLLKLADDRGHSKDGPYIDLNDLREALESSAGTLMTAVQDLKKAFNTNNRELMMGMWIALFVDPVDPPFGKASAVDPKLTESDLIGRAHAAGSLLINLLDSLKAPHAANGDELPQGEILKGRINGVRALVPGDLGTGFAWLNRRLDSMIRAFAKDGGGGGESTYWPSNYVSSSSSSSSSSTYP